MRNDNLSSYKRVKGRSHSVILVRRGWSYEDGFVGPVFMS